MRAFLALELPESVRASLAQVIGRVRKNVRTRASWVREENLHITLRFIGAVEDPVLQQFAERIAKIAADQPHIALRITGLGVYPNPGRAKVLWSGGAGELEQLLHLQKLCEQAARDSGFDPEKRFWTPHVTLARFRESPPKPEVQKTLDTFAEYQAGEFMVSGMTLFSSQLSPRGAVYTPIRKFPFQCP